MTLGCQKLVVPLINPQSRPPEPSPGVVGGGGGRPLPLVLVANFKATALGSSAMQHHGHGEPPAGSLDGLSLVGGLSICFVFAVIYFISIISPCSRRVICRLSSVSFLSPSHSRVPATASPSIICFTLPFWIVINLQTRRMVGWLPWMQCGG